MDSAENPPKVMSEKQKQWSEFNSSSTKGNCDRN
jgi:hypothetical protein